MEPAPQPAAIIPHATGPPSDSSAITGPSVRNGATTMQRNVEAQTHDHPEPRVRDELVPTALEVGQEAVALALTPSAREPEQRERGRADRERDGVDHEHGTGIRNRGDHARDRGPCDEGHAPGEAEQRVRLLEPLRTDGRGHEAGRRGLEERIRRPVDRKEHREVPDLRRAAEQQHGARWPELRRG